MCYISSDEEYAATICEEYAARSLVALETEVGEISDGEHIYVLFYVSCEGVEHIYGIHKTYAGARQAAEGYVDTWREKGTHVCGRFRIATWALFP